MKTALVTMLNEEFVIGFKAMIRSLLKNNPWFDLPVVILDDGVLPETKGKLTQIYKDITWQPIDKKRYAGTDFEKTAPKLRCTYYKLDIFNMKGYERLVFIDSDTLILGDIKQLFATTAGFAAVKGYDPLHDMMRRDINSGVFVVNQQFLNEQVYVEMLRIARSGHKMPDQTVINHYFRNRMMYLDKVFNVEKRMLYTNKFKHVLQTMRILHYVGEKPWQKKTNVREEQYAMLEREWWRYNHE
jgi:lipopolysaccharide biosynthesis glycosyltransferase